MQPLFAAAAALALAILGHAVSLRAGLRPLAAYAASLIGGMAAVLILTLVMERGGSDLGHMVLSALLFGSWWFIFLNFVQVAQSSLRANILRLLLANGGSMRHDALFAAYSDTALVRLRLGRLTQSGTVAERDGRYMVTSRSAWLLARLFRGMKIVALGRRSEFAATPR